MSKQKVSKDLIIGLKEYFQQTAFTFSKRRTLVEISRFFPLSAHRTIRRAIECLRHDHGLMIAAGGRSHKGYFLVDPHNKHDRKIGWTYYQKLMSQNQQIYKTALPFKRLQPTEQMRFEWEETC